MRVKKPVIRKPTVFRRKNLVALVYAQNACYTDLFRLNDERARDFSLRVNLADGTWNIPDRDVGVKQRHTYKIGQGRLIPRGHRFGVIGVFDRTRLEHLSAMITAGQEAVQHEVPMSEQD